MSKHIVVGIAGGSASGKTTLVTALSDALRGSGRRHVVVSADRYMRRSIVDGPSFTFSVTGEQTFNANHPDSINWEQLLQDLDEQLQQPGEPQIFILEGHLVLHNADVRSRLDLRLFIELDADQRALRRLLRDMKGGRGMSDPAHIAAYYLECARVGHTHYIEPSRVHADLIVRGDADWERLRPLLVAVIADRFAHATSSGTNAPA